MKRKIKKKKMKSSGIARTFKARLKSEQIKGRVIYTSIYLLKSYTTNPFGSFAMQKVSSRLAFVWCIATLLVTEV